MMLRDSPMHGALTWAMVRGLASSAVGADPDGYRKELLELVERASKLPR